MLRMLLTALPVLLLCMALQSFFVSTGLRYYVHFIRTHGASPAQWKDAVLLTAIMLLMLIGNSVQIAIWAGLFLLLGEFADYTTAVYHSGVNFATLGYGDIVMSERWRLLGPLEAANGILMFGVSTAVMTMAVMDLVKRNMAARNVHLP